MVACSTQGHSPEPVPDAVLIVGRGRLGCNLARALAEAGSVVSLVHGRFPGKLKPQPLFAETGPPTPLVGGQSIPLAGQSTTPAANPEPHFESLPGKFGLIVLCVPDDALSKTAARLARRRDLSLGPDAVALHTSGAHPAAVLEPLARSGWHTGSWHPIQTFPRPEGGVFQGIRVAVEGDAVATAKAEELARRLGARPFAIIPELKPLYHALCTMACSHLSALLLLCHDALRLFPRGVREDIWKGLLGLAGKTLANLACPGDPRQALTGPAVRGDWKTVARHLEAFDSSMTLYQEVYQALDQAVAKVSKKTESDGPDPDRPELKPRTTRTNPDARVKTCPKRQKFSRKGPEPAAQSEKAARKTPGNRRLGH